MNDAELKNFVAESNRIEGIRRMPRQSEIDATAEFIYLETINVQDVCKLVGVFAPGNRMRDKVGLDVRVGDYLPPSGGPEIRAELDRLLRQINANELTPFEAHVKYESLHPFTDGNGRSGRAIWLWQMRGDARLGFLHRFYYQTLSEVGR